MHYQLYYFAWNPLLEQWKHELVENYDNIDAAIQQTVAMWGENDRHTTMSLICRHDHSVVVTFAPHGENGKDVTVIGTEGVRHTYTEIEYEYDDSMSIIATSLKEDGFPIRIAHNW